jgi:hypothetical protein
MSTGRLRDSEHPHTMRAVLRVHPRIVEQVPPGNRNPCAPRLIVLSEVKRASAQRGHGGRRV